MANEIKLSEEELAQLRRPGLMARQLIGLAGGSVAPPEPSVPLPGPEIPDSELDLEDKEYAELVARRAVLTARQDCRRLMLDGSVLDGIKQYEKVKAAEADYERRFGKAGTCLDDALDDVLVKLKEDNGVLKLHRSG